MLIKFQQQYFPCSFEKKLCIQFYFSNYICELLGELHFCGKKNVMPLHYLEWVRVRVMVFDATFNNISVISWQSVLLVEETGVPGENHRPVASH
jgi:hypothetical protein